MTQLNSLVAFVSALRGAPANLLLALMLAPRPLTRSELCCITGYSERTVRRSVALLFGRGLIRYHGLHTFTLDERWSWLAPRPGPG